jgi:hypothetical protein
MGMYIISVKSKREREREGEGEGGVVTINDRSGSGFPSNASLV